MALEFIDLYEVFQKRLFPATKGCWLKIKPKLTQAFNEYRRLFCKEVIKM